jgi:pilus assembly protein Flp/PilA
VFIRLKNTARLQKLFDRLKREDNGATAIEYALIAALIFLVIVGAMNILSTDVSDMFNDISNGVSNNI